MEGAIKFVDAYFFPSSNRKTCFNFRVVYTHPVGKKVKVEYIVKIVVKIFILFVFSFIPLLAYNKFFVLLIIIGN